MRRVPKLHKTAIATGFGLAFYVITALTASAQENIQVTGVEGSFESGAIVTIHGSGFGTKDPALPVLWDDFESGAVSQSLGLPDGPGNPTIGAYNRISANIIYTDQGIYSGSKSAYELVTSAYWENGVVSNWIPKEAKRSFASMVVKLKSGLGSLDQPSCKILRLNSWDPDATHGYPGVSLGEAGEGPFIWFMSNIGSPEDQVYLDGDHIEEDEFSDPNDEWFSLGLWVEMGDRGVANGFAGRDFNGNVHQRFNLVTLGDTAPFEGTRSAYFAGHVTPYSGELKLWIDEVYADTTFARVTVNDSSKAGTSGLNGGQTAMQIPQSWSDSQIQVKVNTGRYLPGDELSLVVWNADGYASPPFKVTVGGTLSDGERASSGCGYIGGGTTSVLPFWLLALLVLAWVRNELKG